MSDAQSTHGEGPRVLSCGCIYNLNSDGITYVIYAHGEHRVVGEAWIVQKTPETKEAFLRQCRAHEAEIDLWSKREI